MVLKALQPVDQYIYQMDMKRRLYVEVTEFSIDCESVCFGNEEPVNRPQSDQTIAILRKGPLAV